MKKNYIQPQLICSLPYEMEKPLCESRANANANWGNRFKNEDASGINDNPIDIKNDNGNWDSMSKERGDDYGNIW